MNHKMDREHIMVADAEARQLLIELVEAVPGDLGHIAKTIVRSGESQATALAACASHRLGDSIVDLERAFDAHSGPIPWASCVLAVCCQAYGQPVEQAIPIGACLELLGIVSFALDAVQDSHKSLLREYAGTSGETNNRQVELTRAAVVTNAGVAIIGLAWQALLEHGPRYSIPSATVVNIGRLIASSWTTICHAQHLDLTLGRSHRLTFEEYDQIVAGKAGAIGGVATEAGALLVGAEEQRHLWRTLGIERTIALQLWDDYADLDEDLANGYQISHPILYGLSVAAPEQKELLLTLLRQAQGTDSNAVAAREKMISMLRQFGAVEYTQASVVFHRELAREALRKLALPPAAQDWLEQWILCVAPS